MARSLDDKELTDGGHPARLMLEKGRLSEGQFYANLKEVYLA